MLVLLSLLCLCSAVAAIAYAPSYSFLSSHSLYFHYSFLFSHVCPVPPRPATVPRRGVMGVWLMLWGHATGSLDLETLSLNGSLNGIQPTLSQ